MPDQNAEGTILPKPYSAGEKETDLREISCGAEVYKYVHELGMSIRAPSPHILNRGKPVHGSNDAEASTAHDADEYAFQGILSWNINMTQDLKCSVDSVMDRIIERRNKGEWGLPWQTPGAIDEINNVTIQILLLKTVLQRNDRGWYLSLIHI